MANCDKCSRKFTQNSRLIQSIREFGGLNLVAVAAIPLSAIYNIIGLSITQGDYTKFFRNSYWLGVFELVLVGILYLVAVSRRDYKRQSVCGGMLCGFSGANCLVSLFMEDVRSKAVEPFSIVFFIIFATVFIGEIAVPKVFERKNETIINNLGKCYLKLSETTVSGISFNDVTRAGDGDYFELEYKDIRNVRTATDSASAKQYYNFYIDSKYGTYKLSVGDNTFARNELIKAIANGGLFEEKNIPEKKEQKTSARSREGSWCCPNCERVNENYIVTCGCGQDRPFEIEQREDCFDINSKIVICPKCNQKQDRLRTSCFKCGFEFNK